LAGGRALKARTAHRVVPARTVKRACIVVEDVAGQAGEAEGDRSLAKQAKPAAALTDVLEGGGVDGVNGAGGTGESARRYAGSGREGIGNEAVVAVGCGSAGEAVSGAGLAVVVERVVARGAIGDALALVKVFGGIASCADVGVGRTGLALAGRTSIHIRNKQRGSGAIANATPTAEVEASEAAQALRGGRAAAGNAIRGTGEAAGLRSGRIGV
jgi:hypothetical protein